MGVCMKANEAYLDVIFFVMQEISVPGWLVIQEMLNLIFIEIVCPD